MNADLLEQVEAAMARRLAALPVLSSREFDELRTGDSFPFFDPFESVPIPASPRILSLFREYRSHGTRSFYAEDSFPDRMMGILQETLQADVPFFLPRIPDSNMRMMNAIVATLARARRNSISCST